VIDPANLIENLSFRPTGSFKELERTVARIEFEANAAKRLLNRMKDFKLTNLKDLVSQINRFRSRARSIGYTYDSITHQFEKTYGRKNESSKNFKAWQDQSDDSLKDAMVSQGLLEKSQKHMDDLDKITEDKRASEGDADTLQAIGEINAIQSRQLADLSQIVASDARAQNSVIMEQRSKEKELKNYENHLMKDFNKHEKSRPLAYLPSLGTTAPRR
jgi:P-type conjugative transfer protein TrbJ